MVRACEARPRDETALYDAVINSLDSFGPGGWAVGRNGARYLILLSDGGDTVSERGLDQALARAAGQRASASTRSVSRPPGDPTALQKMREVRAAAISKQATPAALCALYDRTWPAEIQNQYRLAFTVPEQVRSGGAGEIVVEVTRRR